MTNDDIRAEFLAEEDKVTPSCFICSKIVLSLAGQDLYFDTFLLNNGDDEQDAEEVQEILDTKRFGACHTQCLLDSPWGEFWANTTIQHTLNIRGRNPLFRTSTLVAFRNYVLKYTSVFDQHGGIWIIYDSALPKFIKTTAGWLRPIEAEQEWNLIKYPSVVSNIQTKLIKDEIYPLMDFLRDLGIHDKLNHPEAVENGQLRLNRKLCESWSETWFGSQISYNQFIPNEVIVEMRKVIGFGSLN